MTQEVCPHCGSSLKKYWHRLTPGLVKTLVKVYQVVSANHKNVVTKHDLILDHSEYGNFQKLRFHALIAKLRVNGTWDRRSWVMTHRGAEFLKGKMDVPARVQTFRNEVVGHDPRKVFVKDILDLEPYFESYEDFKNQLEFAELPEIEVTSPEVLSVRRRGKKMFCSCGGQVVKKLIPIGFTDNQNMKVRETYVCKKCNHDYGDTL